MSCGIKIVNTSNVYNEIKDIKISFFNQYVVGHCRSKFYNIFI